MDKQKDTVRSDFASHSPVGFRDLLSIYTMLQYYVTKMDSRSTFVHSEKDPHDVYVIPPRDCIETKFY